MTAPAPAEPLAFVAPCRVLRPGAAFGWLRSGWNDLRRSPGPSLAYGLVLVLLSYTLTVVTWWWGELGLYLGLLSGFVFVGPCVVLPLYGISIRLEREEPISLLSSLFDARRQWGNVMVFALVLTVVFLVWARAATVIHIFYPTSGGRSMADFAWFLGVGSIVGAMFCAIVFAASAFSLPMLMDRKADAVTAVVTSVNAVLRNKGPMLVWAGIIVACVVVGLLTAYLAFAVLLPLLGYATWHGYRETIDASAWPRARACTPRTHPDSVGERR